MANQDGFPTVKHYQDTLVVSVVSSGGPPSDQGRDPWFPRKRPPGIGLPGPPGPHGGGSSGSPSDLGSQGPPRHSFIWQSGAPLHQSIADMNVCYAAVDCPAGSQCATAATNTAESGCADSSCRCPQTPV